MRWKRAFRGPRVLSLLAVPMALAQCEPACVPEPPAPPPQETTTTTQVTTTTEATTTTTQAMAVVTVTASCTAEGPEVSFTKNVPGDVPVVSGITQDVLTDTAPSAVLPWASSSGYLVEVSEWFALDAATGDVRASGQLDLTDVCGDRLLGEVYQFCGVDGLARLDYVPGRIERPWTVSIYSAPGGTLLASGSDGRSQVLEWPGTTPSVYFEAGMTGAVPSDTGTLQYAAYAGLPNC